MKKNNIILTGMPACGKTTIGLELSKITGLKFFDTDSLIEENEKMKISDIFKNFGEDYFRKKETETLLNIKDDFFILSTGGGIVEKLSNIEILKKMGLLFYLEINPQKIYDRIKGDKTRPLLAVQNPVGALVEIFDRRSDKYLLSDFRINADRKVFEIVDEIVKIYEKNNR